MIYACSTEPATKKRTASLKHIVCMYVACILVCVCVCVAGRWGIVKIMEWMWASLECLAWREIRLSAQTTCIPTKKQPQLKLSDNPLAIKIQQTRCLTSNLITHFHPHCLPFKWDRPFMHFDSAKTDGRRATVTNIDTPRACQQRNGDLELGMSHSHHQHAHQMNSWISGNGTHAGRKWWCAACAFNYVHDAAHNWVSEVTTLNKHQFCSRCVC